MIRKNLEIEITALQTTIHSLRELESFKSQKKPTVFVITPTYFRPVQKAELTRLCQSFLLASNVHWIVVEDSKSKTEKVKDFLSSCGVPYTHLNALTPSHIKLKTSDPHWKKPRGVTQRNTALAYLRTHHKGSQGFVYFADDDNTYDYRLFTIMKQIHKVGVWPVGLVGGLMVEKPRVFSNYVIGWDVAWQPERSFAIDMAGFAVNLTHLLDCSSAQFSNKAKNGHQESEFLGHLIRNLTELTPLSSDKVLVWHTRTENTNLKQEAKWKSLHHFSSNINIDV